MTKTATQDFMYQCNLCNFGTDILQEQIDHHKTHDSGASLYAGAEGHKIIAPPVTAQSTGKPARKTRSDKGVKREQKQADVVQVIQDIEKKPVAKPARKPRMPQVGDRYESVDGTLVIIDAIETVTRVTFHEAGCKENITYNLSDMNLKDWQRLIPARR